MRFGKQTCFLVWVSLTFKHSLIKRSGVVALLIGEMTGRFKCEVEIDFFLEFGNEAAVFIYSKCFDL